MASRSFPKHLRQLGFSGNPFPVTPDAKHYFISDRMRVFLVELLHCIDVGKGFMLVTADIGLGKTTLTRRLIRLLQKNETRVSLVFNSFLHGQALLEAINHDFDIRVEGDIKQQLDALNNFLLEQFHANKNVVIILDDAQNLDVESLELLRQISNLETDNSKLVQILLVAQPEILETLSFPEIRQLKSRIALHVKIEPYTVEELQMYIHYRIDKFTDNCEFKLDPPIFKQIHKITKGYPRQINLIMDRVLYGLNSYDKKMVDKKLVKLASQDLHGISNDEMNNLGKSRTRTLEVLVAMCLVCLLMLAFLPEQLNTIKQILFPVETGQNVIVYEVDPVANPKQEAKPGLEPVKTTKDNSDLSMTNLSKANSEVQYSSNHNSITTKPIKSEPVSQPKLNVEVINSQPIVAIHTTEKPQEQLVLNNSIAPITNDYPQTSISLAAKEEIEQTPLEDSKTETISDATKGELYSFLSHYDLVSYMEPMLLSIKLQSFELVEQQLNEINWSVLLFEQPNEDFSHLFEVTTSDGQKKWLALWELPYEIYTYHYGMGSKGIKQLQSDLKTLGLYQESIDGIVGRGTLAAVTELQKLSHLKATGELNAMTRYMISQKLIQHFNRQ